MCVNFQRPADICASFVRQFVCAVCCRVRFADGQQAGGADGGRPHAKRKLGGAAAAEDAFMRMDDMEAFVQQAEAAAMRDDEGGAGSGALAFWAFWAF